jgi:hypothetical protein
MRTRAELAVAVYQQSRRMLGGNLSNVTIDEVLSAAGGFRSIVGILKHAAGWCHVYHSYAFEEQPKHWRSQDWPRGLRDTIEPTQAYFDELRAWLDAAHGKWVASLSALADEAFDEPRPLHIGMKLPLFDIVLMISGHTTYHAGEINHLLSVVRGEAWEYTEEVEENHISTAGHRVKPGWMGEAEVKAYEEFRAARDAELHGVVTQERET